MQSEPFKRFVALDSLRGVCAILVAIYHFSAVSFLASIPFIKNGFLFVDFFFVLSGFVIASSYTERLQNGFSLAKFMFLRLGRLYPLHLFVLALYVGVAVAHSSDGYAVEKLWTTALLLQAFSDGDLGNWNPPSWSISAEVWTYLVFALLCQFSGKLFVWFLVALIISAPPILWFTTDRYLDVCFQGALLRCLFGFSMGVLGYMFWKATPNPLFSQKTSTLLELSAALASVLLVSIAGAGPLSFLCPPIFLATVMIFSFEGGSISSALKTRPLEFIGTLSYSIYMTHLFVQARLLNIIDEAMKWFWIPIAKQRAGAQTISDKLPLATDITTCLMVAIVIGFAYLTYVYIESPFRRLSRSVSLRIGTAGA